MDEVVSRCRDKLSTFRIKELKDVLNRIGMARQGKKQVLLDRILAILDSPEQPGFKSNGGCRNKVTIGREQVAKIIDDIFRKMKGSGAPDLASKNQNIPQMQAAGCEDEFEEHGIIETRTRCPCGSSLDRDTMIQCDDRKCGVWQHFTCVIIPEKTVEGVEAEVPSLFYCEVCRINRADPFCMTLAHPVPPTKLTTSIVGGEGSSPLQNVEKSFVLSRADKDLLQKPGYDLQVWCLLLNDPVLFRMHWPQYADLRVNGVAVRVTNRPGPQLLGANGRDDGPGIIACSREGTNRISLSAYDARHFCLGVRIIRRQTIQQVLSLVPSESEGEPFEEVLSRVRRCIGGGTCLGNTEDNDSDVEVVADSVTVNLRCPMSGLRITVAGRFKPCEHMGCFDLKTFIQLNERTRKWQCPICLKNYSLENIIIDQYFSRITSAMKGYPEDVTEVEIKPDGSWRPKLEGEARFHEQWHLPDGSICTANGQTKTQVKQEDRSSEGHVTLKIGMKRNRDGHWEVNGVKDMQSSGANKISHKNEKKKSQLIQQCSSATASNGDHEDPSVNQETSDNLNFSADIDAYLDSTSLEHVHTSSLVVNAVGSEPQKTSEIIVLSDSEEEIEDDLNIGSSTASAFVGSDNLFQGRLARLNSSETLAEEAHISHSHIPFIPDNLSRLPGSFSEANSGSHDNGGEFNLPRWAAPSQNAAFQLFGSDTNVADVTANSQHVSVIRSPVSRYNVAQLPQVSNRLESRVPEYNQPLDSTSDYLNTEMNGNLSENSRRINNNDAPLQLLLPPQPARSSVQDDTSEPVISSDILQTNWISLSLGSDNNMARAHDAVAANGRQMCADERGRLDSLANTALHMSNNETQVPSVDNCGSESPFLYHQRARSVRHRLYLPIDSDSD